MEEHLPEQTEEFCCRHHIDFGEWSYLSPLIKTYLKGDLKSSGLYEAHFDEAGFANRIQAKQDFFTAEKRQVLADVLTRQYADVNSQFVDVSLQEKQIEKLRQANSFTLTTGHQLCLFSGPLFLTYKLLSIILGCRKLKKQFPESEFIPIFWMATEDHDWAEINHFYFQGKKWTWKKNVQGAVGEVETADLKDLIKTFAVELGGGECAKEIIGRIENAYTAHATNAAAMRQLIHDLFGAYGLVIIDGADRDLKAEFQKEMEIDILSGHFEKAVHRQNARLEELGFGSQALARPVNFFLLSPNSREYIERDGDIFRSGDKSWTREEMLQLIRQEPEKLSPNVILRPLYQECILPNIAYAGGPGELAYWLQLGDVFKTAAVPMPILLMRHAFMLASDRLINKWEKQNMPLSSIFTSPRGWATEWVERNSRLPLAFTEEKKTIEDIFAKLETIAQQTDQSMMGAVKAQRAKQLKGLEKLEKKLKKAEKRQHTEAMAFLDKAEAVFYPQGIPQERIQTIWEWWLNKGKNPIPDLFESLEGDFPAGGIGLIGNQ